MTALDMMWVGIGGGIGSVIRWGLGRVITERYKGSFPMSTFMLNISGAFVIAYLSISFGISWKDRYGDLMAALVLTGILGGYTTFSSMQLDALKLKDNGQGGLALFYLVSSVGVGLIAAALGIKLAQL